LIDKGMFLQSLHIAGLFFAFREANLLSALPHN
jgi:hypothetical protein